MSTLAKTAQLYTDQIGKGVEIKDFAILYEGAILHDDVHIGEHAVIGRRGKPTKAMVRSLSGEGKPTVIRHGASVSAHVVLYEGVDIGEHALIGDHASIMPEVTVGKHALISRHVTINSEVRIGDHTRIMDNTHITGRSRIGNHVFISVGVQTANDNGFGKHGYHEGIQGPIVEDYVSIGVGVILQPGITIGRGSVIAAGSVVKDDIPANVIAAGNPAKVITRVPAYMKRD